MTDDEYKEYIIHKYNTRWEVEGYSEAIEQLRELRRLSKSDKTLNQIYAYAAEGIAHDFNQGLNTVLIDAAKDDFQK